MSDKKRLTINCWQCRRDFSILRAFDGQPTFRLPCSLCGAMCRVQLAPYEQTILETQAGDKEAYTLRTLALPDVLPSEPDDE